MTFMFFSLSILLSILFFYFNNPLSLGLILILQTIFLSIFLGSMTKSLWFLYLLILVYIGGMLVLFIYVTSIFPNEKFLFNQKSWILLLSMTALLFIMIFVYTQFFFFSLNFSDFQNEFSFSDHSWMLATTKMFCSKTNLTLIFLVNYLFYCMIVVIKITKFLNGPLRQMNYV
uniref:NADH-ubiquinone oxidoreductase chain 6 n=1 Tax=Kilauella sp. KispEL TaxID=1940902 RepID=A0A8K1ZFS0_9NEOP|nr:NADH dehydrogenase subunit 6 [Kilauella sp. KispEL]